MVEPNFHALDIKFFVALDDQEEQATPQIDEAFLTSPWYAYLIFVLFNLNAPPGLTKAKARFIKLKAVKFCIIDNVLYWKAVGGIFLKGLLKDDVERTMQEFHKVIVVGIYTGKPLVTRSLELFFTGIPFSLMSIRK